MNVFEGIDVGGPAFLRNDLSVYGNETVSGTLTGLGVLAITGSITGGSLTINGASGTPMPAGAISMFGAASAPTNWLLCDGAAVSRTTYAILFGIISTTFGIGDGSTTFNVPDYRGIFPKGAGTTNRAAGVDASGNAYAGTLGTYSQDKMQGMGHTFANVSGGVLATNTNLAGGIAGAVRSDGVGTAMALTHASDGTNGTPRTGHTTEPQSLGISFIIYTGV